MFPKPRPSNLITVPSCDLHNSEESKNDEYFRWVITSASATSPDALKLINDKILPQFRRKPKLLHSIFQKKRVVPQFTKSGIYTGTLPGFEIDKERFLSSIDRLVRGLYFFHTQERLGEGYGVKKFNINPELDVVLREGIISLPLNTILEDVFSYRFYLFPDERYSSIWFFMFFGKTIIQVPTERIANMLLRADSHKGIALRK